MTKHRNILEKIIAIGDAVMSIEPNTNLGGCAVYATRLATALKTLGFEDVKLFVTGYHEVITLQTAKDKLVATVGHTNNADMNHWSDVGVYFNHVGVAFKYDNVLYFHDSERTVLAGKTFDHAKVVPGFLDIEDLLSLANNAHGWNKSFRRDMIPHIERFINLLVRSEKVT